MSGRWGRLACDWADDAAPSVARGRGAKSKLSSEAQKTIEVVNPTIDQLSRDLRLLIKEYRSLDTDNDFGRAASKKIEKVFDRADRLRSIYQGIY